MKRVPPFLMSVFVATVVFFSANRANAAAKGDNEGKRR